MHATRLITAETMLVLALGLFIFMMVFRWIFKKK